MRAADLARELRAMRDTARGPLTALLHAAYRRACAPLAGSDVTVEVLQAAERAVQDALGELADAGAFRFFGIPDAGAFGRPPITFLIHDAEGGVMLETRPLVAWVFAGGRGRAGWKRPAAVTLGDLGGRRDA